MVIGLLLVMGLFVLEVVEPESEDEPPPPQEVITNTVRKSRLRIILNVHVGVYYFGMRLSKRGYLG